MAKKRTFSPIVTKKIITFFLLEIENLSATIPLKEEYGHMAKKYTFLPYAL